MISFPPLEYSALKTVVVRHVDKVVLEYEEQEIIQSINRNNQWADVESIYRITNTGRLMKIKFKTTAMVSRALTEGLLILQQKIPQNTLKGRSM